MLTSLALILFNQPWLITIGAVAQLILVPILVFIFVFIVAFFILLGYELTHGYTGEWPPRHY